MNGSLSLIDSILFLGADVLVVRALYYRLRKKPKFKQSLKLAIIWVLLLLVWCGGGGIFRTLGSSTIDLYYRPFSLFMLCGMFVLAGLTLHYKLKKHSICKLWGVLTILASVVWLLWLVHAQQYVQDFR